MDYRRLGCSGAAVSTLALGTMTFGTETDERLDQVSDPGAADYPYGGPGVDQRSRRLEGRV